MGLAGGGDDDIGLAGLGGQVFGSGVAQGDGGVLAAAGKHQADGAANGHTAADDHGLGAVELNAEASQKVQAAVRGARQGRLLVEHELAQIDRVQAIGILGGVDSLEDGVFIQVLGQRQLDDVAGAGVIGVELIDDGLELFLRDVGRQVLADGVDTELFAVAVLHLHIGLGAGVFTDQDGGEAGGNPLVLQRGHALGKVSENLVAVQCAI